MINPSTDSLMFLLFMILLMKRNLTDRRPATQMAGK
jgi:hypothetical protein